MAACVVLAAAGVALTMGWPEKRGGPGLRPAPVRADSTSPPTPAVPPETEEVAAPVEQVVANDEPVVGDGGRPDPWTTPRLVDPLEWDGAVIAEAPPDVADPREVEAPEPAVRRWRVREGDTMSSIAEEVYGTYDEGIRRAVQQCNPHIANVNRIFVGDEIVLPLPDDAAPAVEETQ